MMDYSNTGRELTVDTLKAAIANLESQVDKSNFEELPTVMSSRELEAWGKARGMTLDEMFEQGYEAFMARVYEDKESTP